MLPIFRPTIVRSEKHMLLSIFRKYLTANPDIEDEIHHCSLCTSADFDSLQKDED